MIQEMVTFFGEQGHRMAQIGFLATCVVTPFWIVDFIEEERTILTKFFTSEEEAEDAAIKYAFEGILCDQIS
jgi:hypothetical protein